MTIKSLRCKTLQSANSVLLLGPLKFRIGSNLASNSLHVLYQQQDVSKNSCNCFQSINLQLHHSIVCPVSRTSTVKRIKKESSKNTYQTMQMETLISENYLKEQRVIGTMLFAPKRRSLSLQFEDDNKIKQMS